LTFSTVLAEGPWYAHFWKDNRTDILVIFEDHCFWIHAHDRATWQAAIDHGLSIGIPIEQLDFLVTQ